ncbi:uracil-DNA glycosylase [Paenibacillus xerothermodurans]|uniref:Uracil-DNA glycosylase n=1 Tax=Paenibacillus xerothermodurans TaxID=1977292 RepID=A0A2W1NQ63_PAEXE|nr:uracil-DNA glycosylase [Paenibacillus xerothermodurans]PZE19856.1 uracil-DNA glycosylase [Paenibacillus xerothermodurans]
MRDDNQLLPEESAPAHALNCQDCIQAGLQHRIVWGEGRPNAKIMLLLDNPGAREDKHGNPWLCGTRDTLLTGLQQVHIDTTDVYVTYLLKRRPHRAYDKPLARRLCFQHLRDQIEAKRPLLLFAFGNTTVHFLFGDDERTDVKSMRGRWHEFGGIPTAVSYHPLAVRRRPAMMKHFIDDLILLSEQYRRCVLPDA